MNKPLPGRWNHFAFSSLETSVRVTMGEWFTAMAMNGLQARAAHHNAEQIAEQAVEHAIATLRALEERERKT